MHDIRYDEIHDEYMVTNPLARAILIYQGGSSGNEPPVRVIQGPKTGIIGADRLEVDPVHNEILIPEGDHILVYSRTANGDVAPLRVLEGPDTRLLDAESVVVDPVNNLLFVGTQDRRMARGFSMSKSMISGVRSCNCSRASTPSLAVMTSKSWPSRTREVTLRMVMESSTTMASLWLGNSNNSSAGDSGLVP